MDDQQQWQSLLDSIIDTLGAEPSNAVTITYFVGDHAIAVSTHHHSDDPQVTAQARGFTQQAVDAGAEHCIIIGHISDDPQAVYAGMQQCSAHVQLSDIPIALRLITHVDQHTRTVADVDHQQLAIGDGRVIDEDHDTDAP